MAGKPEFARIIDQEARAALGPLGVRQKGRSRTWLDDRIWWVTVIEFQPTMGANASHLNVGACWLTYAKDYLSFDLGYRLREATYFRNASQFSAAMREYARVAADRVLELRRALASPADALAAVTRELHLELEPDWSTYHAAVFAGLVGDVELARRLLLKLLAESPPRYDWDKERAERAEALAGMDREAFRSEIATTVVQTRALLKLPPVVSIF
jgi:hypothetical protein